MLQRKNNSNSLNEIGNGKAVKAFVLDNSAVNNLVDRVIGIHITNISSLYEDYFYKRDWVVFANESNGMRLLIDLYYIVRDLFTVHCGLGFEILRLIVNVYFLF